MAHFRVTASGEVPVTPDQLWAFLCDTSRYAEWAEGTAAVVQADNPARLGARYTEVTPILGPWKAKSHWTVEEFDPPRRQLHSTTDVPLVRRLEAIMEIAPSTGGSRFTLTVDGRSAGGPLGALLVGALRGSIRRDNDKSVVNVTRIAPQHSV